MQVKVIEYTLGATIPHTYRQYANSTPQVKVTVELMEDDDVEAVMDSVRQMVVTEATKAANLVKEGWRIEYEEEKAKNIEAKSKQRVIQELAPSSNDDVPF